MVKKNDVGRLKWRCRRQKFVSLLWGVGGVRPETFRIGGVSEDFFTTDYTD